MQLFKIFDITKSYIATKLFMMDLYSKPMCCCPKDMKIPKKLTDFPTSNKEIKLETFTTTTVLLG